MQGSLEVITGLLWRNRLNLRYGDRQRAEVGDQVCQFLRRGVSYSFHATFLHPVAGLAKELAKL